MSTITGDYHTHTTFSHGHGSIEQNAQAALDAGLRELAITDHGFGHGAFGVRRKEIPKMRTEINELNERFPELKIYLGVEANILDAKGRVDLSDEDRQSLDIIVCGYHKFVKSSALSYFAPNNLGIRSVKAKVRNTDAYIKVLERGFIDILSHPGNFCPCDIREVARACKAYNTYFELNGKRILISDEELSVAASEDCEFILDSDAHDHVRVGDVSAALKRADLIGLPHERIANYGKLPKFKKIKRVEAESEHQ